MRRSTLLLSLLAFLTIGYAAVSLYAYRAPFSEMEHTVIIPPRTGAIAVVDILAHEGVTPSMPLLAVPVIMSGAHRKLKAGEYFFEPGLSPAQVIRKITRGEIVVHKVTIPEGFTIYQVRAALMAEPLLSGDLPPVIAEGSVFPDTVHFTRGEARSAVLARMQNAAQAALAELWPAREANLPITTPEEALILASVVERETGVADERAQVAGVFINRLRLGMPLQSDPTVAYGIQVARAGAALDRPLTTTDLKADTPYNSYTRTGLPPTPICNPGRAAIAAVLRPAATKALYFVATGEGGHRFAETLAEHQKNVAQYHQTLRKATERAHENKK